MADYAILDEPRPGTFSRFALNPVWPMLTLMMISSGAAWAWFVFNSFAQGSPFKRSELTWIGAGVGLSFAYVLVLFGGVGQYDLPKQAIPYLLMGLTVIKLTVAYRVYLYQARSFELFEYFSQTPVKNGSLPFVLLWVASGQLKLSTLLPPLVVLALN